MTMPEYEVTIDATRSLTCRINRIVTANDEDAAYDKALEQATSGELSEQMEDRWDVSHTDFEIAEVEKQDDEYYYDQFNPHSYFTEDRWAQDVRDGDTHLGYAEWVAHRIFYTHGELTNAESRLRFAGGQNIELVKYINDLRLRLNPFTDDNQDDE